MHQEELVTAAVYGDSIMRATVMEESRRYRTTIGDFLERLKAGFGLLVQNRSRFGSTIEKGNRLLEKDIENGLNCDFALLEYGGNDCSFAWEAVAADPAARHEPATLLENFERLLEEMVQKLKAALVVPVLMTLPPIDAERHLKFIGRNETARRNILSWLGDVQMIYRFHELYSWAVARVAQKTESILVDVRSRFLPRHDWRQLVGEDGVHLSEAGYGLVYESFCGFISERRKNPDGLVFG